MAFEPALGMQYAGRALAFLAPAVPLLLLGLLGLELQFFILLVFWILVELLVVYLFTKDIKDREDLLKRMIDGGILAAKGDFHSEEFSYEDNERYQHAGLALFSMLMPVVILTIFILAALVFYIATF